MRSGPHRTPMHRNRRSRLTFTKLTDQSASKPYARGTQGMLHSASRPRDDLRPVATAKERASVDPEMHIGGFLGVAWKWEYRKRLEAKSQEPRNKAERDQPYCKASKKRLYPNRKFPTSHLDCDSAYHVHTYVTEKTINDGWYRPAYNEQGRTTRRLSVPAGHLRASFQHVWWRLRSSHTNLGDHAMVDVSTPVVGAKGGCGGSTIGPQGLAAGISWVKSSGQDVRLSIIIRLARTLSQGAFFFQCSTYDVEIGRNADALITLVCGYSLSRLSRPWKCIIMGYVHALND